MQTQSGENLDFDKFPLGSKLYFYPYHVRTMYPKMSLYSLIEYREIMRMFNIHYNNLLIQYTTIFYSCKNDNFQLKNLDIFLNFAQNIDCGHTLEPP